MMFNESIAYKFHINYVIRRLHNIIMVSLKKAVCLFGYFIYSPSRQMIRKT